VLINAAGVNQDGLAVRFPESALNSIVSTNVVGTLLATKVFLAAVLRESRSPQPSQIVTIGSTAGLIGNRGQSVYSASKSALVGWTLSLAREYADRGVRAHLLCPGLIEDTAMAERRLRESRTMHASHRPVSVTKDDVIRAVDYLIASPSSNGIILPVGSLLCLDRVEAGAFDGDRLSTAT
jgi:NAD(P)-dependent dehydrogenase (short-subunit alcohol dehydrogenase family)